MSLDTIIDRALFATPEVTTQDVTSKRKSALTPARVITAYLQGYFPMAEGKDGPVGFYAYEPRGIIPIDDRFVVRKSLRQVIRKHPFEIRFDTAFDQVIRACSRHAALDGSEVWLSEEMIGIYDELHAAGVAHSVEAWEIGESGEVLVGGLYGLSLGAAFCGESMFSERPYASQIALVTLVDHLREKGFTLLDAQMPSDHLKQFGLYELTHDAYLELLNAALTKDVKF